MDNQCRLCNRAIQHDGICQRCHTKIHSQLDDLMEFWKGAHSELLPGRSGSGARSSERTIGVNVNALSFIAGDDILGILHEWEKLIRADRKLVPPAFIPPSALEKKIQATIKFHQTHLSWSGKQDWIGEFAREVRELHSTGIAASRSFVEKKHKIACPTEMPDSICGNFLTINHDDPLDLFDCRKCGNQWNTIRLMAVAMSSRQEVWLDAEAIAIYFRMTVKAVHQFARRHKVKKMMSSYDLIDFQAKR